MIIPNVCAKLRAPETIGTNSVIGKEMEEFEQKLALIYKSFKKNEDSTQSSCENIINKFKVEMEEKNPERFIDNLLEASLESMGTILELICSFLIQCELGKLTNVIGKAVLEQIKAGLSDLFAKKLAHTDEKSKEQQQQPKTSKKKKSNKKKAHQKAKEAQCEQKGNLLLINGSQLFKRFSHRGCLHFRLHYVG